MNDQTYEVNRITVVKLDFCEVWLEDDGIVRIVYYRRTNIEIVRAKQVGDAIREVCAGQCRPLFSDARNIRNLSRAARAHWASEDFSTWCTAVATLQTPVVKTLAAFFIRFNEPSYPLKLFTSEKEAIDWLKGFLE